ncbi:MAG: sialate O-acetylesterase [Luteolibacter sp.]
MKFSFRQIILPAVTAALSLTSVPAAARDPDLFIFLCFGQSNMEGFPGLEEMDKGPVDERFKMLAAVDFPDQGRTKGTWYPAVPPLSRPRAGISPADYFGRTLVAKLPKKYKVGVINVSVAGSKIEVFDPEKVANYVETAPDWLKGAVKSYDGDPYQRLVDLAKSAQKDGVIKGILLHQGESNSGDREWPEKVKRIYDRLLKDLDLKANDVPLLAGQLVAKDQGGACAGMNDIIDKLPETIPTAHVISSAGCEARPDHLHFSPVGYRKLGEHYAETMLQLLKQRAAKIR